MNQYMNDDIVAATVQLADRCGADGFELGFLRDNVPVEEALWWAHVTYQGVRIFVENQTSPATAALALAQRILTGAMCRCRKQVTLSDAQQGCRWRLVGAKWEPGCDAPPINVTGKRGDYGAIKEALEKPFENRAARRKQKRRKG